MSFVLDNSVALAWCVEDAQTPGTMAVLDRLVETGAIVPALWPVEALNGLLTAYDAACLELAIRLRLPLATSDKPLMEAARGAGVSLLHERQAAG